MSGSVYQIAWSPGVGEHSKDNPGRNLTGDPWQTDGNRIVLFLSLKQIAASEVHLRDWRTLPDTTEDDSGLDDKS